MSPLIMMIYFSVSAGDAQSVLARFCEQAECGAFLYDWAGSKDQYFPGVEGEMTSDEALSQILTGTGLRYEWINSTLAVYRSCFPSGECSADGDFSSDEEDQSR